MAGNELVDVKVSSGSHSQLQDDGSRQVFEEGQQLTVTKNTFEQYDRKFERVHPSEKTERQATVPGTSRPRTSDSFVESSSEAVAEMDDPQRGDRVKATEFVDRNASTINNAIEAGQADGFLHRVYDAESASDGPRITVQRAVVERIQHRNESVPDTWDVEAGEPRSDSDDEAESESDEPDADTDGDAPADGDAE